MPTLAAEDLPPWMELAVRFLLPPTATISPAVAATQAGQTLSDRGSDPRTITLASCREMLH